MGAAPERVTSSTSTPVLGPVHSGEVPPRSSASTGAPSSCSASSVPISVQSPQPPSSSCTRTCTRTSVTAGSAAQVTPTSEKEGTPVRVTVSAGAVSGTPDTGSVVPCWTSAAGVGASTEPRSTSTESVATGTASGEGDA